MHALSDEVDADREPSPKRPAVHQQTPRFAPATHHVGMPPSASPSMRILANNVIELLSSDDEDDDVAAHQAGSAGPAPPASIAPTSNQAGSAWPSLAPIVPISNHAGSAGQSPARIAPAAYQAGSSGPLPAPTVPTTNAPIVPVLLQSPGAGQAHARQDVNRSPGGAQTLRLSFNGTSTTCTCPCPMFFAAYVR